MGYKFLTFKFFKFIQSGMYLDFIIKKFSERIIKNLLVYSAIFFGEKYIIEFLTKKIIELNIFNFNLFFSWKNYNFLIYYIQIISFLFYFIIIFNIYFLI